MIRKKDKQKKVIILKIMPKFMETYLVQESTTIQL